MENDGDRGTENGFETTLVLLRLQAFPPSPNDLVLIVDNMMMTMMRRIRTITGAVGNLLLLVEEKIDDDVELNMQQNGM